jgi:hypothetical protein
VSPEEVEETAARLEADAHAQELVMSRLKPNLKAAAVLEEVEKKLAAELAEVNAARVAQQEAESRYREVSTARRSLFEAAFTTVQARAAAAAPVCLRALDWRPLPVARPLPSLRRAPLTPSTRT